jgi:hypothetical protein
VSREVVAQLIATLEKSAFRKRLGDVLMKQGKLTKEQDAILTGAEHEAMRREDARVIARYRDEDFAGVERDLIPHSKLLPEDFKISTLFRGKETRALVDKAELHGLLTTESEAKLAAATPVTTTVALDPEGDAQKAAEARVRAMKRIGDYSIVEVLGIGGMGAVFLTQRDGTGEYAAVKVILNERASRDEKERFQREIELTPLVKHRNVISLIDWGTTRDGLTYLVVPALAGKELRGHLQAAPKGLAPEVVVKIFTQVFSGLEAVHAANIVHRDLKPENIFLLAGGELEVKIMDFGLAKSTLAKGGDTFRTMAGEIVGSPAYLAPEMAQCDPPDERTDLYSVGIMLFECLAGRRPIESETLMGFLAAHIVAPPLTLAEAVPDRKWPADVEAYLARLLAKAREERPENARVAREELEKIAPSLIALGTLEGAAPAEREVGETKRILSASLLGRLR